MGSSLPQQMPTGFPFLLLRGDYSTQRNGKILLDYFPAPWLLPSPIFSSPDQGYPHQKPLESLSLPHFSSFAETSCHVDHFFSTDLNVTFSFLLPKLTSGTKDGSVCVSSLHRAAQIIKKHLPVNWLANLQSNALLFRVLPFILIYVCVCMCMHVSCMWMYAIYMQIPEEARKNAISPSPWITGSCEPYNMDVRIELWSPEPSIQPLLFRF